MLDKDATVKGMVRCGEVSRGLVAICDVVCVGSRTKKSQQETESMVGNRSGKGKNAVATLVPFPIPPETSLSWKYKLTVDARSTAVLVKEVLKRLKVQGACRQFVLRTPNHHPAACTENNDDGRCPAPHRGIEGPGDLEGTGSSSSSDSGDDAMVVAKLWRNCGKKERKGPVRKNKRKTKVVFSSSDEEDSDQGGEGVCEGGKGESEGGDSDDSAEEGGEACQSCVLTHSGNALRDKMSLCDRCNKGYHVKCMRGDVRFTEEPTGDWFCQVCVLNKPRRTGRGKTGGELFHEPEGIQVSVCYI